MSTAPADQPRIAILGSGSLARATCYGLATAGASPLMVYVVARSPRAAADVCHVAGARATLARVPVEFMPITTDLADSERVAHVFADLRPMGALLCASTQSPWERAAAPSAWTTLLDRAGFGLTLPFHAELARTTGEALRSGAPDAWFLNACFPDGVNPLLAALGVPVLAGIGNVALLAASLSAALGGPEPERLALLAHHAHLHAHDDEALAWLDGAPVPAVGELLARHRAVPRQELNNITGYAASLLLRDLVLGRAVATHAPGPAGLPGGYPVWIGPDRRGRPATRLRLPDGVSEAEAVAANQRWAALDGVVVDSRVTFGEGARSALSPVVPDLADGFAVGDLAAVTSHLHDLRDRLRTEPPGARVHEDVGVAAAR